MTLIKSLTVNNQEVQVIWKHVLLWFKTEYLIGEGLWFLDTATCSLRNEVKCIFWQEKSAWPMTSPVEHKNICKRGPAFGGDKEEKTRWRT